MAEINRLQSALSTGSAKAAPCVDTCSDL